MGFDLDHVQAGRAAVTLYVPASKPEVGALLVYISERVRDFEPSEEASAMASVRDGAIIGAVAYHNYRQSDIEMVCAGEPGWLNRVTLKAYFGYPFFQLGCRRVTAIVHRKNKRARKFNERLGFKMEGVHREAMADGADAISYGLLRSDCKWI